MALPTKPIDIAKPGAGETDVNFQTIATKSGFLAAWTRYDGAGHNEVLAQRLDIHGKAIGKLIVVADGEKTPGVVGKPALADVGGGDVGIVWQESSGIKGAVIDGQSGAVGKPTTIVANGTGGTQELATLAGGKIALLSNSNTVDFPNVIEHQQITILDKSMHAVGKPTDFYAHKLGMIPLDETVIGVGKGGVSFYVDRDDGQLYSSAFNATGKSGHAVKVNTTHMEMPTVFNAASFSVSAAELSSGGYVVAWASQENAGNAVDYEVRGHVYNANGKPIGKDFLINVETEGSQNNPEVIALKKGFAVAWTDDGQLDARDQNIRFFDQKGHAMSDEITTEHYTALGTPSSVYISPATHYAVLADGSLAKVYGELTGPLHADGVPAPMMGTAKNDTLKGTKSDDLVLGGGGKDEAHGGAGNDVVDGFTGDDQLFGDKGADTLIGGEGSDVLRGGGQADVFVFEHNSGHDTVADFKKGDHIDLTALHFGQVDRVLENASQNGKSVEIHVDANVWITLQKVDLADLGEKDFLL
ncbi:MAG: hypothetical protein ABW275_04785 [Hansschlegelia sp.]